jgi:hypothetical protein
VGEPLIHWLVDVVPLALLAAALVMGWRAGREHRHRR